MQAYDACRVPDDARGTARLPAFRNPAGGRIAVPVAGARLHAKG